MDMEQVLSEQPTTQPAEAVAPEVPAEVPQESPVEAQPTQTQDNSFKEDATGRLHAADGKFAPKNVTGEKNDAVAEQIKGFQEALIAERRKRQALEQQLFKKPEFWDDPEAALKGVEQQVSSMVQEKYLDMSEALAQQQYGDYLEMRTVFGEMLQRPGMQYLQAEALSHPNPAQYVYQTAKRYSELQKLGSLEEMQKKMEADIRARVEAETRAKVEAELKRAAAIPSSLSDVTGASASGSLRQPNWEGPTPLSAIFK